VSGRGLLARAAEVAASVGSACHEEGAGVSGVLGAMGFSQERARGAVRLSIGEPIMEADIREAADALIAAWRALVTG
jgi:cysteine desulfurase